MFLVSLLLPLARGSIESFIEKQRALGGQIPNLVVASEDLNHVLGEEVELAQLLVATWGACIFAHSGLVIKYQVQDDSNEEEELHPLSRDYFFAELLAPLGIAPNVFYLSPEEMLPEEPTWKTQFGMTEAERASLVAHGRGVRFMVEERMVRSIFDIQLSYEGGRVPPSDAILLGIHMIQILRKSHDQARVVHGDIHGGNVMVRVNGLLGLVDFGRARFLSPDEPTLVEEAFSLNDPLLSPWEIAGFPPMPRDDVYRAIMLTASMLQGASFDEWFAFNNHDTMLCYDQKIHSNLFLFQFNPFESLLFLSPQQRSHIHKCLELVMRLTQGLVNASQRPPYELILAKLYSVYKIISNSSGY